MAAARKGDPGEWMPAFLAALSQGLPITAAAGTARIAAASAYYYRRRDPAFARAWQAALAPDAPMPELPVPAQPTGPRSAGWRIAFLEALVETSNVSAAAARAAVPLRTVYKTRRDDAGFAAKWRAALHEGYDNLEMEVLGYLRDPAPSRKMDVAAALRLLVAHRETVARERALRDDDDDDEQAVLDSIDQFIEGMRQRRAANAAILKEQAPDDDGEE